MSFNLDTIQLEGFIAISDTGSFSAAAHKIGRTQSALSLQVKKLEETLGCALITRTSRSLRLTDQGEIFLAYARRIVGLQHELFSQLREPDIEGEIRFGTPEDFATHYLPDVLASFRAHHPRVQLNVACDLTLNLLEGFHSGQFEVILVKRDPERVKGGTKVWREPLVWAAADKTAHNQTQGAAPLALVLSPQPCIYRARALAALDRAKKPWRISYTSPSLAGTLAAVKAGMGVTVLPANMLPAGITPLGPEAHLPALHDAELALMKREGLSRAGEVLAAHIVQCLETKIA